MPRKPSPRFVDRLAFPLLLIALGLALAAVYVATTPVHAGERSDCGLIRDHDLYRSCAAHAWHSPSDCGLISDHDEREYCFASARRGR